MRFSPLVGLAGFLGLTLFNVRVHGATAQVFSNDSQLVDPANVASDGTHLYIGQGSKITRIPLAGGAVTVLYDNMTFDGISVGVSGLAVNTTDLFFIDPNGDVQSGGGTAIFRVAKGGGGTLTKIYSGALTSQIILDGTALTTDGTKLYATDEVGGETNSMNLDCLRVMRLVQRLVR